MSKDVLIVCFGRDVTKEKMLMDTIASLKRHASGVGKVFVIGHPPKESVLPGVERRYVEPLYVRGSMYDNAMHGIMRAVADGFFHEDFLYLPLGTILSNDMDIGEDINVEPKVKIKSMADMIRENKGGAVITRHRYVLSDTRNLLERNGYDAMDYTGISPLIPISIEDILEVRRLWIQEPHGEFGYDIAALFGNVGRRYKAKTKEKDEVMNQMN